MVMGKPGGRKGRADPSAAKKFEENREQSVELAQDRAPLTNYAEVPMVHSPSHDPRLPFMFNPEVLVTPWLGPGQVVPSQVHSLPQSITDNKDDFIGRWISVEITWKYAGNLVAVVGSWDNWQIMEPLLHGGKNLTVTKVLPAGTHYCCFIVDGVLGCAPDLQWVGDAYGNRYNIISLQEDVLKSTANGPANLPEFEHPPSPPLSYDNRFFTNEDFWHKTKEGKVCEVLPPELPPQLEDVVLDWSLLDKPSSLTNHCLPRPEFAQLNHLYTRKDDQYVAFSSTQRMGDKYVTAILYKALPKTK
ncbi:SNF1-related protein kinase regulatory subunit beta-2-like isoform X1 [Carya illinoinensis]|uniref:Association with the SNF1 complex (ASC) domain-containing protein n=2 Tax=Carya illinoinensis TaxID=32201 RepID=A0A8T1R7A0_CARIL|nr:SNF1-related protein kinase regulatory subunit beta-2-like isoform X1 [Carya illinoinensis]KAG6663008.1 hypothetical protein CIPAW_03G281700 [Carya illinoinensis]